MRLHAFFCNIMKNLRGLFIGLLLATAAHTALAEDNSVSIPQVSDQASGQDGSESPMYKGEHNAPAQQNDYQQQILSNPEISDIGRANALTGGGGNTAIITQEGSANRSTVTQRGKSNYARQRQIGTSNDINLNQQGDRNESDEEQQGEYNHKTIIQNGHCEDSTAAGDCNEPENQ